MKEIKIISIWNPKGSQDSLGGRIFWFLTLAGGKDKETKF